MEQKYQPQFIAKLFPILSNLEKVALVVLLIGLVFKFLHLTGADEMLMISMTSLAVICFLSAYKPPAESPHYFVIIVAKVLPIACSVCWIGILFFFLHMTGYQQMLLIGSTSIISGLFVSLFLLARIPESGKILQPHLIRAVPLAVVAIFVLYQYGLE